MAKKPWAEPAPKVKREKKALPEPEPEPEQKPRTSRRRRATGAMAKKPWEDSPPKVKRKKKGKTKAAAAASPPPSPAPGPWAVDAEPEDEPEQQPLPSTIGEWGQLSLVERTAAQLLGFTAERWPAPAHLTVVEKVWSELSSEERVAAEVMRYTQALWDAEDSDDEMAHAHADPCATQTLEEWLDELGLAVCQAPLEMELGEHPPEEMLAALRDLDEASLDTLSLKLALEYDEDERFRAAVERLKPDEEHQRLQAEVDSISSHHRLAQLDKHASFMHAERDAAATKMQARWRGCQARKSGVLPTGQASGSATEPEPEPEPEQAPLQLSLDEAAGAPPPDRSNMTDAERRAAVYNLVGSMTREELEAMLERMDKEGPYVVTDDDLRLYLLEEQAAGRLMTTTKRQALLSVDESLTPKHLRKHGEDGEPEVVKVFVRRHERDGYGIELDETGRVTSAEGAGAKAGVRVGWTITAVDGDAVRGRDAVLGVLLELNGAELTLENLPEEEEEDPDAEATKLQAQWRGYRVRKERKRMAQMS